MEKSKVLDLYQQLHEFNFSDEELDEGYHVINYNQKGKEPTLTGAHNGRLENREINEFILNHYENDPRLKPLARQLTGSPIPWELDDDLVTTDFDRQIREKSLRTIECLKQILVGQGYIPDTPKFEEYLAIGLLYYADFPDNPEVIQDHEEELLDRTRELEILGLRDFQSFLLSQGGLGLALCENKIKANATALSLLHTKKGACAEYSEVLYALYKMAGLNPFFVFVENRLIEKNLQKEGIAVPSEDRWMGHVLVGLNLGRKNRYFDPLFLNSNARYRPIRLWQKINLLAEIRCNDAFVLTEEGNLEEAQTKAMEAISLDPSDPMSYRALGEALLADKKMTHAKRAFEEACLRNQKDPWALWHLGHLCLQEQDLKKALSYFKNLVKADPKAPFSYAILGSLFEQMGKKGKARAFSRKAMRLDGRNPEILIQWGTILYGDKKWNEAEEILKRAVEYNPHYERALQGLSLFYILEADRMIQIGILRKEKSLPLFRN